MKGDTQVTNASARGVVRVVVEMEKMLCEPEGGALRLQKSTGRRGGVSQTRDTRVVETVAVVSL